jgi:hypothetical protein
MEVFRDALNAKSSFEKMIGRQKQVPVEPVGHKVHYESQSEQRLLTLYVVIIVSPL